MVILANFNFFILKLHQRNVYNLHLLLFLTSEGKDVNKCIVVDNDSLTYMETAFENMLTSAILFKRRSSCI